MSSNQERCNTLFPLQYCIRVTSRLRPLKVRVGRGGGGEGGGALLRSGLRWPHFLDRISYNLILITMGPAVPHMSNTSCCHQTGQPALLPIRH